MRVGIISDIHGNLDALNTVLVHAGKVDLWICLGDTVGYGPEPNECVDKVRELCETVLIGNHDLAAIERLSLEWFNPFARAAAEWTQAALTPQNRAYLEKLPETRVSEEWNTTFAHGSLTDPPRDYITSRSEARANFPLMQTQALLIGHGHLSHCFMQVEGEKGCDEEVFNGRARVPLRPGVRFIINPGSVGQPRDGDPRAAYGILDTEAQRVDVFRVKYDIAAVQEKMKDADLPSFLIRRLSLGQ